jgi:2'-5' RNA ligase
MNQNDITKKRYKEIWATSKKEIAANKIKIDPYLQKNTKDERRGLTFLIPLQDDFFLDLAGNINKDLRKILPNQYFTPESDLHITVMDLIQVSKNFVDDPRAVRQIQAILEASVNGFHPFEIRFRGLCASPSAIFLQGFAEDTLLQLREKIREAAKLKNFHLDERYQSVTAHVTLVRFKSKFEFPHKLIKFIDSSREKEYGEFRVKQLDFVSHDWYNSDAKTTRISTYKLSR